MKTQITFFLLIALFFSCKEDPAQKQRIPYSNDIYSISGEKLTIPTDSTDIAVRKDSLLQLAIMDTQKFPDSLLTYIWQGRRLAYQYKYGDAIKVYTEAMEKFPDAPELYRHRGHRFITTRNFDLANQDFAKAAALVDGLPIQIEPDGIPNKLNIPLSNLQFNIWYHWGVNNFILHDYAQAAEKFEKCLTFCNNADLTVATVDWLYMTYHRIGDVEKAQNVLDQVSNDMAMIENESYFKRIMMYKGIFQADDLLSLDKNKSLDEISLVTQGFGVANWYLIQQEEEKANRLLRKIVQSHQWAAFGYIAAESELYTPKKVIK